MSALIAASFVCVIGFTAGPFAIVDNNVNAAIIAGVFSTINIVLNAVILRHTRDTRRQVKGAKRLARESMSELVDVKRKVHGERRANPPAPRPDGKRKGIDYE